MIKRVFFLFLLIMTNPAFCQKKVWLRSPDGNITFSFELTRKSPLYQVAYKGRSLIVRSGLGLSFLEGGTFGDNLDMGKPRFTEVDETYNLVVGKASEVRDQHREVSIPLFAHAGVKRQVNLVVRAFNDGLAFRYEFPQQD